MDIGLNIAFHIRWLIPFSRWLIVEVDSRMQDSTVSLAPYLISNISEHHDIRWYVPSSRWLTVEADSWNYGLGWKHGDNIHARINGLKLQGCPRGYCVELNIALDILWLIPFPRWQTVEVDLWNHGLG